MANTKDYAMREMIYDRYLNGGHEYTCKELMELVNRDLDDRGMKVIQSRTTFMLDMKEMGMKLRRVYGRNGIVTEVRHRKTYYRYADGIEGLYNRMLTAEEQSRLQMALSLLQGVDALKGQEWVDELTARIDQGRRSSQTRIISFEGGSKRDGHFFVPLFNAIISHQAVRLCYRKFGAEPTERVVWPYFLKQYRQRWYLFVRDERRPGVVCFALDRIVSMSIAEDVTFIPSETDFSHYFDDIIGVTKPQDGRVAHVRLWVDNWLINYLRTSPVHQSQQIAQQTDDGYVVTLEVIINHELEQELLTMGEHVRVLGPQSLCDQMRERVSKML